MQIKECINQVDSIKPNQYSIEDKVRWLCYIDRKIVKDVIETHERSENEEEILIPTYTPDDLDVELIAPAPYDELYVAYLKMKIDEENGETARYNNSAIMFNAYMQDLAKYWNKTHRPKTTRMKFF